MENDDDLTVEKEEKVFQQSTGCKLKKICGEPSYEKLVKYLYEPKDPASLGIARFLFGFLMLADLPEERGGSDIDLRWGEPRDCHFSLFNFLQPLPFPYMALLYGVMWLGACGVMLGYKFQLSTVLFGLPYWYIFLLDKSYWNNHSYLYGIITLLLLGSSANHYFSVDGIIDKTIRNRHVPRWNYFILKFQFFMLYFVAGLKKTDTEWLEGYSMANLSRHWVFYPFHFLLTNEQIDYLVVHWVGFLLDLTVGFWLLIDVTRPFAMVFCASFHLMNSRLFSIGMFPYVCLATMPLFCSESWPRQFLTLLQQNAKLTANPSCIYPKSEMMKFPAENLNHKVSWRHKGTVAVLLAHCGIQAFLPYSHFITQGYNNWTNGLYGYSWDMMVHSWDTTLVVIKVVDNNSGESYFLDPEAWTQNDRWNKHADMCVQYAQCLKKNLLTELEHEHNMYGKETDHKHITSENISVYIDVWCSLNGRFQQRMYDPNYDLLKANWSPFKPVEWLKPVLSEYSGFRTKMGEISKEVFSWSNYTDILFVADFPGLYLENYITEDLSNVTLTVLEGEVYYEVDDKRFKKSFGIKLSQNDSIPISVGIFHKIHTISATPSCFMYVYVNKTKEMLQEKIGSDGSEEVIYSPFPMIEDVRFRIHSFLNMIGHISNSFLHVLYNTPVVRRARLHD